VRKILRVHQNVPPCGEYHWSGAHERYRVHAPSFQSVTHGESEDRSHNCSFLESALINGLCELNLSHRFFLGAHSRAWGHRPFEESILIFSSFDILERFQVSERESGLFKTINIQACFYNTVMPVPVVTVRCD
jgi:hypothetical protein